MRSTLIASTIYFAVVFAVGFFLGAVRVLALAPRFGETVAVLLELPVILTVSWIACRWLIARFCVPATLKARLAMGAVAFALLMIAEISVSVLAFGLTLSAFARSLGRTPALLGLAGQLVFALLPALQRTRALDNGRHG